MHTELTGWCAPCDHGKTVDSALSSSPAEQRSADCAQEIHAVAIRCGQCTQQPHIAEAVESMPICSIHETAGRCRCCQGRLRARFRIRSHCSRSGSGTAWPPPRASALPSLSLPRCRRRSVDGSSNRRDIEYASQFLVVLSTHNCCSCAAALKHQCCRACAYLQHCCSR